MQAYEGAELELLQPHADELRHQLRVGTTFTEHCEEFAGALARRGRIDDAFFAALERTRPHRRAQIHDLRLAFAEMRRLREPTLRPDEQHPGEALADFLADAFDSRELRRFVRRAPGYAFVRHLLEAPGGAPGTELAQRLVDVLKLDQSLDDDWFAALRLARPGRLATIGRLEALWRDPRTLDSVRTARSELLADLDALTTLLGAEGGSRISEVSLYRAEFPRPRVLALVGWLADRGIVEWDVSVDEGRARPFLQLLRGFWARFVVSDGRIPLGRLRSILPRAHTRVFLSYSGRADMAPLTRELREALLARGYDVFLDETSIRGAADWRRVLIAELRRTGLFVALANQAYWESAYCQQELGGAYSLGKSVLIFSNGAEPRGFAETDQYFYVGGLPTADPSSHAAEIAGSIVAAHEQAVRDGTVSS